MQAAKITAAIILIIMAGTWSAISYKHGFLVAVSENFMYLAGTLGSVVFGDGIRDILQKLSQRTGK